ncbi:hypothetical protein [Novosphingobium humi]|uniref:Uncharacterized protein n=1 Tax=Novosphingobium humi TaxID=2282397 RepID=A0ABY7U1A0_9SPHN|nr:hypothetical protein [Novosphingobium humi]WCT78900.1 hypothetical protein PQ457_08060 [Novosphingobium humi]
MWTHVDSNRAYQCLGYAIRSGASKRGPHGEVVPPDRVVAVAREFEDFAKRQDQYGLSALDYAVRHMGSAGTEDDVLLCAELFARFLAGPEGASGADDEGPGS